MIANVFVFFFLLWTS